MEKTLDETFGSLSDTVLRITDERNRYRDLVRQARTALHDLFADIDAGVLVRDISRDSEADWWKHAADLVTHLKRAQMALNAIDEAMP